MVQEWYYEEEDRPQHCIDKFSRICMLGQNQLRISSRGFTTMPAVPTAKIIGDRHYSIISDYIGRLAQVYDDKGNVVWQADYDIYGNLRNLHGGRQFIPFRQLGQYEDEETGLYYNRFRYYASRLGNYISQDPIRLAGNNPTLYGYVKEPNSWVDVLGLQGVGVPFQVGLHEDLIRINAGTGLNSHHVGQKSCNGQISEKLRCNEGSSNSCSFGWSYKN